MKFNKIWPLLGLLILYFQPNQPMAKTGTDGLLTNWRSEENGGINVLWCYLKTHGIACDYKALFREQEIWKANKKTQNASLLITLAAQNGLPLEAVELNPNQLSTCQLPVIVHMDGDNPKTGAFLLIFAISSNEIDFINGPTATVEKTSFENFLRVWSGTALLPPSNHQKIKLFWIGFIISVLVVQSLSVLKRKIL